MKNRQLSQYQRKHRAEWVTQGLWKNRTVADEALMRAEQRPHDIVVHYDDGTHWTYAEVAAEALALASSFRRLGLKRGDVVSFQLPNWREVVPLDIAASLLGIVLCPIIPIYRSKELQFILKASGSKLHLTAELLGTTNYREMLESFRGDLSALRHITYVRPMHAVEDDYTALVAQGQHDTTPRERIDADDIKLILYTSGTTGVPKGVLHTHNSVRRVVDNMANFWTLTPRDVVLMPSPVGHLTGFVGGIEIPFAWGNQTAFMEKWNAEIALAYVHRVKASICISATPFLQELVELARRNDDPLPTMRIFACGGAAVPPTVIESVSNILPHCQAFRVYGSSETPMVTQGFLGPGTGQLAANTDGKIVDYEVKVVDADGKALPLGEEGEILSRGPAMFVGYADPEHDVDACDAEGYWRSGDLGKITPQGAILITGRKKDLIIRGGENLSAKEIEDVLNTHPEVREAAVVSMPHPRLGEGVCAFVIPHRMETPPALKTLTAHCDRAGLAKQKWPERLEIVSDLPRTPTGKIKKNDLRAIAERLVTP